MLEVGEKIISSKRIVQRFPFECTQCNHKQELTVIGVGNGQGKSPYFRNPQGASRIAETEASKSALNNLYETLDLVRCPKCKKQDPKKVFQFWRKQLNKLLQTTLFFAGFGICMYFIALRTPVILVITGGLATITLLAIYFIDIHWRWKRAEERISFCDKNCC